MTKGLGEVPTGDYLTDLVSESLPTLPDTSGSGSTAPIDPRLTDVWNYITDPLGTGADYFPTQVQLQSIADEKKKSFPWLPVLGVGALLFLLS